MQDHKFIRQKIADKLYFKIGEVSELVGLPAYVLRFWETEFSKINPKRTPSGRRLYTPADIELILEIKQLLYGNKFTIQGARQHLESKSRKKRASAQSFLGDLHAELKNIRDLLD
jgi:DNA-binding transcriptional MerR regulator